MRNGKLLGYSTISHRLAASGGKVDEERLQLGAGSQATRIVLTSVFDGKGRPVRKEQEVSSHSGVTKVVATFDAEGAKLVIVEGRKQRTETVPLAKGASTALASEFWFLRDHPSPGAAVRSFSFDCTARDWSLLETRYVGPKKVKLGNREINGYEVHTSTARRDADCVLDSRGLPLLIEDDSGVRIERVNP